MHTRQRYERLRFDIKKLERESRKFLYTGILLGMAIHLLILFFIPYQKLEIEQKKRKTIPITLKNMPPAETEPFKITPPETKQKSYVTKQFRHGMPSKDIITTAPSYDELSPSVMAGQGSTFPDAKGPYTRGTEKALPAPLSDYKGMKDTIDRRPKGHISVTDEMISISDLDTGQYKSMLILDPTDPLNTKGYVHVPTCVEGITFKPNPSHMRAVVDLCEGFYRYTGIQLKVDRKTYFSSRDLMKYPFVYISWDGKPMDFARFEAENFYCFLESGGFALAEIGPKGFREFYDFIQNTYGESVQITPVPDEVYSSLIDMHSNHDDIGVRIKSRLCIIHSGSGSIEKLFCDYTYGEKWLELDTVFSKWGINILYYALTQSPKTHMLVDGSSRAIKNSRLWWDYEMHKKYNEKFEVR